MLINDMRYLEEVVEASSVVGGGSDDDYDYHYYKYCKKEKHYDEHEGKYYQIYKCWEPYEKDDDHDDDES